VGEATRVIFACAGQEYVDERVPLDTKTFAKPEFDAAKAAGELDLNMGRLPILTYNGNFKIGQSKTIERFVATKLGFYGANEVETAEIDMLCEHVSDIRTKYGAVRTGKSGEELTAAVTAFITTDLGEWLTKFETVPCVQGNGHFIGTRLSLADILMHQLIFDTFGQHTEQATAVLATHPKIAASVTAVREAAKDYLSKRPERPF